MTIYSRPEVWTTREWREALARAIKNRGATQESVAKKIGITQPMLSAIKTGAMNPSPNILAICDLLKIDPPLDADSAREYKWLTVGRALHARTPTLFAAVLALVEAAIVDGE